MTKADQLVVIRLTEHRLWADPVFRAAFLACCEGQHERWTDAWSASWHDQLRRTVTAH